MGYMKAYAMYEEDDGDAWAQLQNEQRRYEEEEAILKADPDYERWLDQFAAKAVNEEE